MIDIDVSLESKSTLEATLTGFARQLPFAYSVALNDTVNVAQRAIQNSLPDDFTLRARSFIVNTIYRKPGQDFATKQNLVAAVRVNPDRNFLAKFEIGGEKRSLTGRDLTVPLLRLEAPNIIIRRGDPLSAARLLASITAYGGRIVQPRVRAGVLRTKQIGTAFLIHSTRGTYIVERTGPGRDDIRWLYKLTPEVPIKAQLHFDDIAEKTALASFQANFDRAIDYAILTAYDRT